MNGACPPTGLGCGSDPMAALAAALELVARGLDQLRAALDVEWQAPAAQFYRVEAGETVRAVAHDLSLLEEARHRAGHLAASGAG